MLIASFLKLVSNITFLLFVMVVKANGYLSRSAMYSPILDMMVVFKFNS